MLYPDADAITNSEKCLVTLRLDLVKIEKLRSKTFDRHLIPAKHSACHNYGNY